MIEDLRKDIDLYREAVKFKRILVAWVVFDVSDRKIIIKSIQLPNASSFPGRNWREVKQKEQAGSRIYPEKVCYTDHKIFNLRTKVS